MPREQRVQPLRALAVLVVLLTGCAGQLPADPSRMSPEQLKAAALDRSASASCIVGTGPWGRAVAVYVNLDKGTVVNGQVTIDGECKTTISNEAKTP